MNGCEAARGTRHRSPGGTFGGPRDERRRGSIRVVGVSTRGTPRASARRLLRTRSLRGRNTAAGPSPTHRASAVGRASPGSAPRRRARTPPAPSPQGGDGPLPGVRVPERPRDAPAGREAVVDAEPGALTEVGRRLAMTIRPALVMEARSKARRLGGTNARDATRLHPERTPAVEPFSGGYRLVSPRSACQLTPAGPCS
jgi:hypothetical protein